MKHLYLLASPLLLSILHTVDAKAQNGVYVYSEQLDTLCFDSHNLISISHAGENMEDLVISSTDTTVIRSASIVDSICFESLPDFALLKEGIGEWTEMLIRRDGAVLLSKLGAGGAPSEVSMMLPHESAGAMFTDILFDDNANPVKIMVNGYRFDLEWTGSDMFNLIVCSATDSIAYRYDSLSVSNAMARQQMRMPDVCTSWQTKVGATLQLIGDTVATVAGAVMIAGSRIGEIFTVGAMAPESVLGIAGGGLDIAGGISSVQSGWENMWGTSENYNAGASIGRTIYFQAADKTLGKAARYLPDTYFAYLMDTKYHNLTNPVGWTSFFLTAYGDVIAGYGKSFSWFDLYNLLQDNKVVTPLAKDINTSSATLRGYVAPDILRSKSGKLDTEYGIVVCSVTDRDDYQTYKVVNGEGGMFETTFNDLTPGREYSYVVYYVDKTNMVSCLGGYKQFATVPMPVELVDLTVNNATYYPDHYTYNGEKYSFRYNCTTRIRLRDEIEGVEDWGYIYVDPDGRESAPISLKDYTGIIDDPRYAYCRNESSGVVTLKPFVRFADDENTYYGEKRDFPIAYPETTSMEMTHCTFQGTEYNVSYQGAQYKYKSTFRFVYIVAGAYWLKVLAHHSGAGWSNWGNDLPETPRACVDGVANAMNVNYYYNDKTFTSGYNVYMKATDATHGASLTSTAYATYEHNGTTFSGCTFHQTERARNDKPNYVEDTLEQEIDIISLNPAFNHANMVKLS